LFSQYIIYYAEQEGLYSYLDRHQELYGKYSRQLPRKFIMEKITKGEHELQEQFKERFDQTVIEDLD
jgi:uncharacterized protein YwgA